MTQLTENLTSFKELREKTGASLSDSKKALEESNGDITKAYQWLFQNSNTFIATGEISFQIAMQEINKRLSELRETNHHATNLLKEAETTIKTVSQEFIQLEPDLVKLGKNAFNGGEWTISQNHNISKLLNQISVTKIKLSDAEVAKNNRQEESKKGFWSRVKVAVGDILDQTESLKQQLYNEYIDLAKIIITSSDNNQKLNEIALESLVIKVREIDLIKISAEANQNSALSTLTQTKHDIGILSCTAKKNLHVCTDIAQFEECMQGFDVELCEELRKHTNKILATNLTESVGTSASTLADGVLLVAKGVNGQLELLEDKIRIKRQGILSFMNHGFKGDKEILIERISAIQFKNSGSILSGYIQFSFMGSQEAKGGLFDASKDENTVVFTLAEQDKFEKLKHRIEQKMIANRTGIQQLSTSSNFDDLEKLANLRDKGIITEEEFQVKKRQILGL